MRNFFILLSFCIISCTKPAQNIEINKLEGYWKIDKVIFSSGEEKQYLDSSSIDYIKLIDSLSGYKVKLEQQIDNSFQSNNIKENFNINKNGNTFYINYKTELSSWKEEIKELNDSVFVVKNSENITYFYKQVDIENEAKN